MTYIFVHQGRLLVLPRFQVWGTTAASSKRNASISSATSATDAATSQGESTYPSWSQRSGSSWDDVNGGPQKVIFYCVSCCHFYVLFARTPCPYIRVGRGKASAPLALSVFFYFHTLSTYIHNVSSVLTGRPVSQGWSILATEI